MARPLRMGKYKLGALITLSILVSVSGYVQAESFAFLDPAQLYSTFIPDGWVFQAHHSTTQLAVFYGEGEFDLLYFESLGETTYVSVKELADRSLELYESPGGLGEFRLERPLQAINVVGQWGLACGYSYVDARGNHLNEYRVFLLLPGNEGFSIAVSSDQPSIIDGSFLGDILAHWRWLF